LVEKAVQAGQPYAVAVVDMRMPPGWNGVETIEHLWRVDQELQVIICTAYSDIAWDDVLSQVRFRDQLVILRKPFDPSEAYQLVLAMAAKWDLGRRVRGLELSVD
jgi:DNA-binding NtrC family response regulator